MKSLAAGGLLLLLGFAACGDTHQSYEYHFTLTGSAACDTGTQTFTSLGAMCLALESAAGNNNCALTERQAFFVTQKFPGTFQETP